MLLIGAVQIPSLNASFYQIRETRMPGYVPSTAAVNFTHTIALQDNVTSQTEFHHVLMERLFSQVSLVQPMRLNHV